MGKDDQAYFAQRAAEEKAAAERATSTAAATVHRELSLRYSLKVLLPGQAGESDEARPIGEPKRIQRPTARVAARRPAGKRNRA